MLRNAKAISTTEDLIWWFVGGHAIGEAEYNTKEVGYQLGLRGQNICTAVVRAMKGPMKGATIGHAKQRLVVLPWTGA